MSAASVIVAIVILLGALVSYAFVQQTVKNKKEQKIRLVNGLKARSRNFRYMLNGFPNGFLPKELTLLVQKSLIDVCEQLSRLEPKHPNHLQDLQLFSAQMSETQKLNKAATTVPLESPHQIKEVKACLEELHKFVYRMEERLVIPKTQAQNYRNQIKNLVLQVTVDSYSLNGSDAHQNGKTKLSIHYYELALNLIIREAKVETFKATVEKLKNSIASLKEKLTREEHAAAPLPVEGQDAVGEEERDEWDKLSASEDSWKKKNVYD